LAVVGTTGANAEVAVTTHLAARVEAVQSIQWISDAAFCGHGETYADYDEKKKQQSTLLSFHL
jgi:hypothetical protein